MSFTPREYRLFISHAWTYDDDYHRVVNRLNDAGDFRWRDLSITRQQAISPDLILPLSNKRLFRELESRIQEADCLVVIAGMYDKHREWVQTEMDLAREYATPIIGVTPWGQERIPIEVQRTAREIVGCTTNSIIAAIKRYSKPVLRLPFLPPPSRPLALRSASIPFITPPPRVRG